MATASRPTRAVIPTATFDSKGNAYIGGVLFDINCADSAFVVMKSNADVGGTFYHTPAARCPFQEYRTPVGVVASDNDPNIFHDKEFIVADATASSPKADNVYATWTRFDFTGGRLGGHHSPIYFSQSTDGGATWSPGIEISGAAAALCTVFSGEADPNACDQDQGSHPIVGRDGTVYVAFGNGNTPGAGLNQHLIVKCPAAADCSVAASWTAPDEDRRRLRHPAVRPGRRHRLPGRTAVPAAERLPDGRLRRGLDRSRQQRDAVLGLGGLPQRRCELQPARLGCRGDHCRATTTSSTPTRRTAARRGVATVDVTPAAKIGKSAQWMPWSAVTSDGKKYYVAYYDRSYGNCETTAATTSRWRRSTRRRPGRRRSSTPGSRPRRCRT